MVLPHDIVQALHLTGRLEELSPLDRLREFWAHARTRASECPEVAWPAAAPCGCPHALGLHGDDCRFTDSGQKVTVVSLNLLMDDSQRRYPLFVFRVVSWHLLLNPP